VAIWKTKKIGKFLFELRIPVKVATQTAGMLPPKPLIVATPFGAERRGKLCFTPSL
jgi:hypothetical protein